MRRRFGKTIGRLAIAAASLTLFSAPLLAAPDSPGQRKSALLHTLTEGVAADTGLTRAAHDLLDEAGLAAVIGDLPSVSQPNFRTAPDLQSFDMRLVFGMLAQAFGYVGNQSVMDAQGSHGHHAALLKSGQATLADLSSITRATEDGLVLTQPLVIWNDASLHIEPGERLLFSEENGAFIINFGHLTVSGASIASDRTQNTRNKVFRPFVVTTGPGVFHAEKARFAHLGFGATEKFSGLAIVRNALERPTDPSFVVNSVLERLQSLTLHSADKAVIAGNRIVDAEKAALIVARSRDSRVFNNIVSGTAKTNAIRIISGSVRSELAGNVILSGDRAGILIKGASNDSILRQNVVWKRDGSGIKVDQAHCVQIVGNILIGNRQKGIEVRRSREALLGHNLLASNNSAGIWISAQPLKAVTRIEDNILDANGSGIATATAESIVLEGNDFSHQFPQFFAGDLVSQTRHVARDLKGKSPVALSAAGPVSIALLPDTCDRGG